MKDYELTTIPILCPLHCSGGEISREIGVDLSPDNGRGGERYLDLFLSLSYPDLMTSKLNYFVRVSFVRVNGV